MNNIVIVEDKLKRGISLAKQINELSQAHSELGINIAAVCYFHPNEAIANSEIAECGEHDFPVIPISLWNFSKVLDKYMDSQNEHAIVIMDFLLENDGSEGMNIRRVNIKYARRSEEGKRRRIWFYTTQGDALKDALCELVGKEKVLDVTEVTAESLRLDLEDKFLPEMQIHDQAGA